MAWGHFERVRTRREGHHRGWRPGRPEFVADITGWNMNGSRIQRVMQRGIERVGLLFLAEVRTPRGHDYTTSSGYIFVRAKMEGRDKGCAPGIRSDLSKVWRLDVEKCTLNCVEVRLRRKEDNVVLRVAVKFAPPRGSVDYRASEMQDNCERSEMCDVAVGVLNFRPTQAGALDLWDASVVDREKPVDWWSGWKVTADARDYEMKRLRPPRLRACRPRQQRQDGQLAQIGSL